MTNRSIKSIRNALVFGLLFIGIQQQAHCIVIFTGDISTKGSSVDLTFSETDFTSQVSITAGQIMADENITRSFIGPFWKLTLNILLDATIDDELDLNLTLQHITAVHSEDMGAGGPYNTIWDINAEDYPNNSTHSLVKPAVPKGHGSHFDRFFEEGLNFTISTSFPEIDDITQWGYTLQARHIPEPGTLVLMILGGLGLLGFNQWRAEKRPG